MFREIKIQIPESTLTYFEDVARVELEVRDIERTSSNVEKIRDFMLVDCLMWGSGERFWENVERGKMTPLDLAILQLSPINQKLTEDYQKRKRKENGTSNSTD